MTSEINRVSGIRYDVSADVRLSITHWVNSLGRIVYAVALIRGQEIDHESAQEFHGALKDAEGVRFAAVDYATSLVAGELGECPPRFFRDNVRN